MPSRTMAKKYKRQRIPRTAIPLVSTTQAAALMGVSVRTLWRIIEDGELPIAGVIGNSNIFYKDEVLALRRRLYGR